MDAWPIVGRAHELDRLERAVVREQRGAVVAAPEGIGKSTLLAACAELAERQGMCVARTTATRASGSLPFGALAPFLPRDDPAVHSPTVDAGALLRRYADALVARASGRPLVVVVDDAHLLDPSSATLVHQLAHGRTATVLAAIRTGEPTPDAVLALWKDGLVERCDLPALSPVEVADILESVLGGPVEAATASEFARRSEGNPLFLRELVAAAVENGALRFDVGIWRQDGPAPPSARLVELVDLRLGTLTDKERTLLQLIALSEPLGRAELEQLGDTATIESLENAGLIKTAMDGRRLEARLEHPLYGEVVVARMLALREQELARRRAAVIEKTGLRRREDVLRTAVWRLVGGGGSPELLLEGAQRARRRLDHALAERLARAAVDAGGGFEGRFIAAESTFLQGRGEDAEAQLGALAKAASTDAERVRVAATRFDNALYVRGQLDLRILEEAEAVVTDPHWRDELLTRRLVMHLLTEGARATVDAARPILERASTERPSWASLITAFSLVRMGRLDEALALTQRPVPEIGSETAAGQWFGPTQMRVRGVALVYAGRISEAISLLVPAYERAIAEHEVETQALLAAGLAPAFLQMGRLRTAAQRAREAVRLFSELGRSLLTEDLYIAAALALASAGKPEEATATLAARDAAEFPKRRDATELLEARAWIVAAEGDLPRACRLLEHTAEHALDVGNLVGAAAALHGSARLGKATRVHVTLEEVAREVDGALVPARAAHTSALAARSAGDLEAASLAFQEIGALLYAAEAAADAAVIHRRAGRSRAAAAAEQRAATLMLACEGARTPALQAVGVRATLSPAELATARLAAAGRSNKAIAEELCLSVRTVENRLQRVYEKVGISGRSQLGALFDDS